VVVDDGVQVSDSESWSVVTVALAGAVGCELSVGLALGASDETPAAAVGDVAELGDADMDQ